MLKKYAARLEDPNHPLLGPTLWGLQSWGMYQPNIGLSRIIYNLIHLAAILFVVSQYVELWFVRADLELVLRNLSVTMLSSVCVVKAGTFVVWQPYWQDVIQFVSTLERGQLEKKDKTTCAIIEGYTKYSRNVTYFYWCLVTATVFIVILAPLGVFLSSSEQRELMLNGTIPFPEIMSSWVPFDKTQGFGYWFQIVEHSVICFYGGGIVANYDANTVALMSFFCGQLELLVANTKRLFSEDNNLVGYSEAMERIKQCHMHHLSLIKYSKILNSLLSPVMFLYVVICSLMICASAILLTKEGTTTMQRMWVAEYLVSLIAQLFLYCWHSNEVYFMSERVDRGIYESEWWRCGVDLRRCVLLLGGQLRKTIIFEAGPFTKLTIATFVAILKGSYSYYTLLSNNEG
ncbi:odorant receptor Or2-like [Leguminivora glycinivorella]|uniref:odorant receptor Or2-like n=1 Tax=Leguminivora glycinivorella TaxID=1035111 RepID=UPI00200F306C|nr:odorant receptor Or2-like [Leguminivora glycinivorella]